MITYDSIVVNTYTLDTQFIVDPGYTLLSLLVHYDSTAVNTCTLDTHSFVDPVRTLLSGAL